MIPIAKIATPGVAAASPRRIVFRIFQDDRGHWCAESDDGMTGGTFFEREAALRFVRRETTGVPALVLLIAPETDGRGNLRLVRSQPRG
ncbi:MAG TPA: hypothetical protein VE397_16210 [Stellaceae bacterium]|jgi:hypothetical protein|nr:hypothetical protein [Stellaceae bacterium]